jgi:hypothetical protein
LQDFNVHGANRTLLLSYRAAAGCFACGSRSGLASRAAEHRRISYVCVRQKPAAAVLHLPGKLAGDLGHASAPPLPFLHMCQARPTKATPPAGPAKKTLNHFISLTCGGGFAAVQAGLQREQQADCHPQGSLHGRLHLQAAASPLATQLLQPALLCGLGISLSADSSNGSKAQPGQKA